jgi:hypothetical protein
MNEPEDIGMSWAPSLAEGNAMGDVEDIMEVGYGMVKSGRKDEESVVI